MFPKVGRPVLQDPLISQRSPFEIFLLIIGVFAGLQVLVGAEISLSVAELDPELVKLWGWFLFVGCGLALVGIGAPQRKATWMLLGLHVERFGLTLLAGACAVFAYVMYSKMGDSGAYVSGQNLAFAAACLTRVVQIARRFRWYYASAQGGDARE